MSFTNPQVRALRSRVRERRVSPIAGHERDRRRDRKPAHEEDRSHRRQDRLISRYPSWTTEVEEVGEGPYLGTGPRGDQFVIRPELNREFGVVDFEAEAGGTVERSRSRLFDVGETACQLVHLAVRWDGIDDGDWERHGRGTDDDLVRMKRPIEAEPSG